ncbi:unnamed protein product [Ectocarpus sp. 12 AP-2014]
MIALFKDHPVGACFFAKKRVDGRSSAICRHRVSFILDRATERVKPGFASAQSTRQISYISLIISGEKPSPLSRLRKRFQGFGLVHLPFSPFLARVLSHVGASHLGIL